MSSRYSTPSIQHKVSTAVKYLIICDAQHPLSVLSDGFLLHSPVWLVDRGDVRGPGSMAPSSASDRLVVWRQNGHTVLAGSRTLVHGAGDDVIPRNLFIRVLTLDVKPLGPNTSLFSYFALFPRYRPLLVGPKSHLSSPSEEVSKVLLVLESE